MKRQCALCGKQVRGQSKRLCGPCWSKARVRHMPDDFPAMMGKHTSIWLGRHYRASMSSIVKWRRQAMALGHVAAHEMKRKGRAGRQWSFTRKPDVIIRDTSLAGLAASFLQRSAPVYRCDASGRIAKVPTHWRVGDTVMIEAALLDLAEARGWVSPVPREKPKQPRRFPSGGPQARHVPSKSRRPIKLKTSHAAIVAGQTLFPSTVVHPADSPRLLISGFNSRKIGKAVVKGKWRGMPIFTLTLEERATCPRTCEQWRSCFGNHMHFARRHIHGHALVEKLRSELAEKASAHPGGFVVRLHVLGDFYSVHYVDFWQEMLASHPALHIFGFTARLPETLIGARVLKLNTESGDRCWIRFSGLDAGGFGARVIDAPTASTSVVCPAQTGKTRSCGTCGLCWSMDRTIEFLRH